MLIYPFRNIHKQTSLMYPRTFGTGLRTELGKTGQGWGIIASHAYDISATLRIRNLAIALIE